jgi:hypothetical protein
MSDFSNLPKQWIISEAPLEPCLGGHEDNFGGFHIQAAAKLPILRLLADGGEDVGRLIGWVIDGQVFHRRSTDILLPAGMTPDALFRTLGGRFVMFWRTREGRIMLREDSAGSLPAVYSEKLRAVASTVTALETLAELEPDPETVAIFDFPASRGFLPFGLTSRIGVTRVTANHALDLGDFSLRRIWPSTAFCVRPDLSEGDLRLRVAEIGQIVRRHMQALLTQGETVLYLSGGHDSRMILAAAKGLPGQLRSETLGTKDGLDCYVSSRVARLAGIPNRAIESVPASRAEVEAWLRRAGYSVYDFVSEAVTTMVANEPPNHPLSGTGSELARATNWKAEDVDGTSVDLDTLLERTRIPATPAVRQAGRNWLDGIPKNADAAMILDLCKIEQIHGCWAGASVYGHPMQLPSIHPFSGQDLTELVLSMPKGYRKQQRFFPDYMAALAPELLDIPVNKAIGLDRLRFWKYELNQAIPNRVKRWIKPFR